FRPDGLLERVFGHRRRRVGDGDHDDASQPAETRRLLDVKSDGPRADVGVVSPRDLAPARRSVVVLALLVAALAAPAAFAGPASKPTPPKPSAEALTYTDLIRTTDATRVDSAVITGDTTQTRIKLTLRDGTTAFSSYLPSDTLVQQHLVAHRARVTVERGGTPLWLIVGPPLAFMLVL